ncbi:hypothetical protein R1flu_025825 [Riccia fluitans]|uniref:Uncharacterized protein n=1 Tax=Riccia fluitans TaxID=41844 RepID=A0ABD1XZS5_9MARC
MKVLRNKQSVRTRRAIIFEPPKVSFDGSEDGRTSPKDGQDVKRPGISFVWENAPGKPKIEEKVEFIVPMELKPPPQTLPSIRVRDTPPPAGTPPAKMNPFAGTLPPPTPSMLPSRSITMPQTSELTAPPGSSFPTERSVMSNGLTRSGHNSGNQDIGNSIKREMNGSAAAESHILHGPQERGGGNHHYLPQRFPVASPANKDFYAASRNTALALTVIPSSRLAARSDEDVNSAADSHSSAARDDEHNTDAGDIYSQMDHHQAQCQVSLLDGCVEPELTDTSRHTDPSARDFIMQRFLPAAKAMVTESPDNDKRSPNGTPLGSPRKGSRPSAIGHGRSRFAASKHQQQQYEDEERDDDETGMLFKCKFPWQVSPFGSLCLPAPAPHPAVNKANKCDEKPEEEKDLARTHEGFESRVPGANFRSKSAGSSTKSDGGASHHQRDILEQSPSFSVDSLSGGFYEGEGSMRSNDSRRAYSSNHRDSAAPSTPPKNSTELEFAGNLGTLLKASNLAARKETQPDPPKDNIQSRQQLPPSGSLPDLQKRDSELSQLQSGESNLTASASSPSISDLGSNGEGSKYSRHVRLSLYRGKQETPGASGRSLESIDDEAWETIDRETSSSTPRNNSRGAHHDQPRSDRMASYPNDNVDDARATGWPLGKAYSALSRASSAGSKQDSSYSRTTSTDSKHGTGYLRTASSESKIESTYGGTASNESKLESPYVRSLSSDSKQESPYARKGSTDSKNEFSASMSDSASFTQQKESEKFSPVSVLPPPLPKAPRESWLGKLMPAAAASFPNMSNRQQAGQKKLMEQSIPDVSTDVKWESLVKSESAHLGNIRLAQDPPFSTRTGGQEA